VRANERAGRHAAVKQGCWRIRGLVSWMAFVWEGCLGARIGPGILVGWCLVREGIFGVFHARMWEG
jgi:hypothetical protein